MWTSILKGSHVFTWNGYPNRLVLQNYWKWIFTQIAAEILTKEPVQFQVVIAKTMMSKLNSGILYVKSCVISIPRRTEGGLWTMKMIFEYVSHMKSTKHRDTIKYCMKSSCCFHIIQCRGTNYENNMWNPNGGQFCSPSAPTIVS